MPSASTGNFLTAKVTNSDGAGFAEVIEIEATLVATDHPNLLVLLFVFSPALAEA